MGCKQQTLIKMDLMYKKINSQIKEKNSEIVFDNWFYHLKKKLLFPFLLFNNEIWHAENENHITFCVSLRETQNVLH